MTVARLRKTLSRSTTHVQVLGCFRWFERSRRLPSNNGDGQERGKGINMNTRKHFQAAAEIVKDKVLDNQLKEAVLIADAFALFFKRDNPRFDKGKFIEACGL